MQRNVTDILTEWFYRLPNGYAIQPYNAKELKVLEEVLNDQGIPSYPVIKYLQEIDQLDQAFLDAKPIKEDEPMKGMQIPDAAKATATTVTHETYFAIAMAYIIANNAITTPKTEDEFVEIANRTGKYLKDRKNTKIQKRIKNIEKVIVYIIQKKMVMYLDLYLLINGKMHQKLQ